MLIFNTYQEAYTANAVISTNMRLSGSITQQWAEPQEREDGKWEIPKPDEQYMQFVTGYTEDLPKQSAE
jgi:hypothetical protein